MSKDFRFYGGFGSPFGSYRNRTDLNILDSTRPKSFGISAIPSFSVGYFTSGIDGSEDQRAGAMGGGNVSGSVPFSPIGLGISKSLPGSGESFLATPTALEIGTPNGGSIGISSSDEIFTNFSDYLRDHLRKNANFSSRQR